MFQSLVRLLLFSCNNYKIKVTTSIITPRIKKTKKREGGFRLLLLIVLTHTKREAMQKGNVKEVKAKMVGNKLHHHCCLSLSSFELMPYLSTLQENATFLTRKIGQKVPQLSQCQPWSKCHFKQVNLDLAILIRSFCLVLLTRFFY